MLLAECNDGACQPTSSKGADNTHGDKKGLVDESIHADLFLLTYVS